MLKQKIALTLAASMLLSIPAFADTTKMVAHHAPVYLSQVNTAEYQGTITDITNKQITVNSNTKNQGHETIMFNLSRETKFDDCHLTELKIGDAIIVKHSLAMTSSVIPQSAAFSVKLATPAKLTFNYEGTVKEVSTNKDYTLVLVETSNSNDAHKEIRFVISKDTKMKNDKVSDIKVGTKLNLSYGMVMTMSIPPQTSALSLEIVKDVQKTYEYEGKITNLTKSGNNLLVTVASKSTKATDKEMIFVVSSNTKIEDGKLTDLKVGAEVDVKYGSVVTASLPPQTAALIIELD